MDVEPPGRGQRRPSSRSPGRGRGRSDLLRRARRSGSGGGAGPAARGGAPPRCLLRPAAIGDRAEPPARRPRSGTCTSPARRAERIRVAFAGRTCPSPPVPRPDNQGDRRRADQVRQRDRSRARGEVPVIDEHCVERRRAADPVAAATRTWPGQPARPCCRRGLHRRSTCCRVRRATASASRSPSTRPRCRRSAASCRCATALGRSCVRRAGRGDGRADHAAPTTTPGWPRSATGRLTFGPKTYRFTTTGYDTPMLIVGPALKLTEHGRVQRKVLRSVYYPLQQRRPLRDAVVFISWKGKQCGDNPLGIAEELRRRGDTREHIWVVNDWSVPGARRRAPRCWPGPRTTTRRWPARRYVIANDDMQAWYVKREGQLYVQTWHGTPLKRIGFDVEPARSSSAGPGTSSTWRRTWPSGICCCRPTRSARRSCAGRSATTARSASPATRATTCCAAATPTGRGRGSGPRLGIPDGQAGRPVRADLAGQPVLRLGPVPVRLPARPGAGLAAARRRLRHPAPRPSPHGRRRPGRHPARLRAQRDRLSRTSPSCSWSATR